MAMTGNTKILEIDGQTAAQVAKHIDDHVELGWQVIGFDVCMDAAGMRYYTIMLSWAGRGFTPKEPG